MDATMGFRIVREGQLSVDLDFIAEMFRVDEVDEGETVLRIGWKDVFWCSRDVKDTLSGQIDSIKFCYLISPSYLSILSLHLISRLHHHGPVRPKDPALILR